MYQKLDTGHSKVLNTCTLKCDNFIVIGDFNTGLANLDKVLTCFLLDNPRYIDLILTNNQECFKGTRIVESGFSDFHSMVLTAMKSSLIKRGPRIITYRDYKIFDPLVFEEYLKKELAKNNFCYEKFNYFIEYLKYKVFNSVITGVLDNQAL